MRFYQQCRALPVFSTPTMRAYHRRRLPTGNHRPFFMSAIWICDACSRYDPLCLSPVTRRLAVSVGGAAAIHRSRWHLYIYPAHRRP